jgi:hypothetical protein
MRSLQARIIPVFEFNIGGTSSSSFFHRKKRKEKDNTTNQALLYQVKAIL